MVDVLMTGEFVSHLIFFTPLWRLLGLAFLSDVAVVEFCVCQTMKNVRFQQNLRAPIGQAPTTLTCDS